MKRFFIILTLLISSFLLFAQEVEAKPKPEKRFDIIAQFEPGIYINTASKTVSAPSPIIYPVSIGVTIPNDTFLAVQPSVSFFSMTQLFYQGKALPAEIENRTSTTLFFMFTLPAVLSFQTEKFQIQVLPGISVLTHACTLANNVKPTDSGDTGSAESDVQAINSYLWDNGRFLYLAGGASALLSLNKVKAGPVFNMYIPVGSIISGEGFQAMIISAGLKIAF